MISRIFSALALCSIAASAGAADPSWPVLQRAGLTGKWAQTCAGPPSPDNWVTKYYGTADGRAHFTVDRGPTEPLLAVTTVDEAAILTPTRLRWKLRYDDAKWGQSNGMVFTLISEITGKRMRSLSSTDASGKQFIKDGKFVGDGQPVPFEEKCSD